MGSSLRALAGAMVGWAVCLGAGGAEAPPSRGQGPGQEGANVRLGPWHEIGPLPARADAFEHAYGPEQGARVDLSASHAGMSWRRRDQRDGAPHSLPCPDGAVLYQHRVITCDRATAVTWTIGADDGLVVWCNGRQVLADKAAFRNYPTGLRVTLPLQAGENHLLVKVWNMRGRCGFLFSTGAASSGTAASAPAQAPAQAPAAPAAVPAAPAAMRASRKADKQDRAAEAPERGEPVRYAGPTFESVRLAVRDLIATCGERYPQGAEYLRRLDVLEESAAGDGPAAQAALEQFRRLSREALLANPALDFDRILLVRRRIANSRNAMGPDLGFPKLNSHTLDSVKHRPWDNEVAVLTDLRGRQEMGRIYKPAEPVILCDMDLHFDGRRLMFSSISQDDQWHLFEIDLGEPDSGAARRPRQLTPKDAPDVAHFDSCYLPDGRIAFTSTAAYQGLPCEYGSKLMAQLYSVDPATGKIAQLTFEQDSDWCPTVLPTGRIMYLRWEYIDTPHYFTRVLMSMNPDGTDQKALYGSNSYFPNSFFFAKPIPGTGLIIGVAGGHHGISRSGRLLILDPGRGQFEADGVVQEIPFRGRKVEPIIKDNLVDGVWPQFLHPFPLNDRYFLVAAKPDARSLWGIYLADVFDNLVLLKEEEGSALLEPIPLRPSPAPPAVPDRTDPQRTDAVVYITDVHIGAGLEGVPRGTVKALRVLSYDFAHQGEGGHNSVGVESGWDVKRIIGTVPVEADGSAMFRAPANLPLAVQPLDEFGRAVQLFRSWFVAKPGEFLSCVGCHESPGAVPPVSQTMASAKPPAEVRPWYGPARPFSFRHEVQPVLDRYCIACHDGTAADRPNLADAQERSITIKRNATKLYSNAYVALQYYVRRPGPEGDYHLYYPMEYHAGTSELIQMLSKGHHGVRLDREAWERLHAWIDLNAPYRGRWYPAPLNGRDQHEMRLKYARLYANVDVDPAAEYDRVRKEHDANPRPEPIRPAAEEPRYELPALPGWPIPPDRRKAAQLAAGAAGSEIALDLAPGVSMRFARVPAGRFIMGSAQGCADEGPPAPVEIDRPFWMGVCEVTNRQYQAFDPRHDSRYIDMPGKDQKQRGYPANGPEQPVIRVSWQEAMAFCCWLSGRTGRKASLPTEAQWEWACRAGAETPLSFGGLEADFSAHANLADVSIRKFDRAIRDESKQNEVFHERYIPRDERFSDGWQVTAAVGSCAPNAWGLHDMHGNVFEWTRSSYRPYPYRGDDGRNDPDPAEPKVARGGSWRDRPRRATASFRLPYQGTQKVFNVGFRVIIED